MDFMKAILAVQPFHVVLRDPIAPIKNASKGTATVIGYRTVPNELKIAKARPLTIRFLNALNNRRRGTTKSLIQINQNLASLTFRALSTSLKNSSSSACKSRENLA